MEEIVALRRCARMRFTLLLALSVSTAALAACSSSGSSQGTVASTGGTASAASSSARAASGAPIVIGTIYSQVSALGPGFGGNPPEVMNAWVSLVNANGGINGHPVKLYSVNDDGNPTTAL